MQCIALCVHAQYMVKQSYGLYDSGTEWNWEIHSHIVWCNFPRQIIIYFHFKQTKNLLVQKSPICQGRYGLFDSGMKRYDEIRSTWANVNFNDQCWEHGNLLLYRNSIFNCHWMQVSTSSTRNLPQLRSFPHELLTVATLLASNHRVAT